MDLQLKQWRSNESEQQQQQQPSVKFPKLPLHSPQQQQQQQQQQSAASSFFQPESSAKITSLSASPDIPSTRMGSHFSLAQWQELELQALIYRYMSAGAAVPPELLQPLGKSLVHSPSYFLHHPLQQYPHCQPSWYWGRAGMDMQPGRCRRTDGKKWRCSRDVVAGHKYCERHVHRGRSRSRKPVELPTPHTFSTTTTTSADAAANKANHFGFSGSSNPTDLLQLNQSSLESKPEDKGLFPAANGVDSRSDGHILRHFFDDWPRSRKPDNSGSDASAMNSATSLSISTPGNLSSDFSLKLYTGNGVGELGLGHNEREPPQLSWGGGWAGNQVASMGGPLAEALRSSTSSSPTSVLHQLPRGSAAETSYVSA